MRWILAFSLLASCASLESSAKYPDEWWAPVPVSDLKPWEIPPQAADRSKNEVIISKRTSLGVLSNFAHTPFIYRGKKYASIEGFWQMMKYPEGPHDERLRKDITWEFTRDEVAAMTDFAAKSAGQKASDNMKRLGIHWITFENEKIYYRTRPQDRERHYQIIVEVTQEKINQNDHVKKILKSTGDLILLPDHQQEPNSPKAYRYFEIYVDLRRAM